MALMGYALGLYHGWSVRSGICEADVSQTIAEVEYLALRLRNPGLPQ